MSMVERTCQCCKRSFSARAADVARGWAQFCSKRCKAIQQERQTGQYRDFQDRQRARDFDYACADPSWDAHKSY